MNKKRIYFKKRIIIIYKLKMTVYNNIKKYKKGGDMNTKEQKGITLIVLVITLVIIAILTTVVVETSYNLIRGAKLQTLNTNMLLIQAKEKVIAEKHFFDENNELVGTKISDMTENEKIENLVKKEIIQDVNDDGYYVWNQNDLDSLGLNAIKLENGIFFIVNYNSDEVIYSDGFVYTDGKTYYELKKMLELEINN